MAMPAGAATTAAPTASTAPVIIDNRTRLLRMTAPDAATTGRLLTFWWSPTFAQGLLTNGLVPPSWKMQAVRK
ncbi:hypothetical protein L083_4803 [Actinoplanes sp. N902-109]|nr:hypothetical protein L083_4803 [Actinoplanes sp. N902-109]